MWERCEDHRNTPFVMNVAESPWTTFLSIFCPLTYCQMNSCMGYSHWIQAVGFLGESTCRNLTLSKIEVTVFLLLFIYSRLLKRNSVLQPFKSRNTFESTCIAADVIPNWGMKDHLFPVSTHPCKMHLGEHNRLLGWAFWRAERILFPKVTSTQINSACEGGMGKHAKRLFLKFFLLVCSSFLPVCCLNNLRRINNSTSSALSIELSGCKPVIKTRLLLNLPAPWDQYNFWRRSKQ